jgi:predicted deacylase
LTSTTYRVELVAPDISAYRRGNTQISYVSTFDSGVPGSHVMVNAVTHGNEICGAIVIDRLFKLAVRPRVGRLTLSFANVEAYLRFDPKEPQATRFVDEDFNRVWSPATLTSMRDSSELQRAREMRPLIDDVDLLLDIHSMHDHHEPVMICGALDKGIKFARNVGVPNWVVADRGHANGTRMRDYGGFGDPQSTKNALLVECGQHWEARAAEVAWQTTWRFLEQTKCVSQEQAQAALEPNALSPLRVVRVTDAIVAKSADFRFRDGVKGLDVILKAGDIFAWDAGEPVCAPYDNCVLVMPSLVNVKPGLTAVRIGQLD